MTDDEADQIRQTVSDLGIPELLGYRGPVQRLGGLTNRVYRLGEYVLRLPGVGTDAYIDRANEAAAAGVAARVGVSPALLHASAQTGIMVTAYVQEARTMDPDAFRTRAGAPARAAHVMRRLHQSKLVFPASFDVFAMMDRYLAVLSATDVAVPSQFHETHAQATAVRTALASHPRPQVPCHCDPVSENFLDTGARMWLLDWEYSGMSDPMWDLADLAVEAEFDQALQEELLHAYFGREPGTGERARVELYKPMCDLLWTLWGLLQVANNNPTDDYAAYAAQRLARCRDRMAHPDFAGQLRVRPQG